MPKPAKPKPASPSLPVLYPEVVSEVMTIDPDKAKQLLGWQTEGDDEGSEKFGGDYLLIDEEGNKVRCVNNPNNRPLYRANVESLMQEMLNRRWMLNGEALITDKYGRVHNGQHTLTAVVLAGQRFNIEKHWKALWKNEPFAIRKVVVHGIEGDDLTVNTIDTAKPRSLTDVLYRGGFVPAGLKSSHRRQFSGVLEFAIRYVWSRTGAGMSAYTPRRTHSEAVDFFTRHKSLLDCVKHVWEEEGDGRRLKRYLPLGTLAGMLYMMGVSGTTDVEKYREKRHEKFLDKEFVPKAEEFVTLLAGNSPDLAEVRKALAYFDDKGGSSQKEREAVLIKAFMAFAGEDKLVAKNLIPKYTIDADTGVRIITETITLHGPDMGDDPPEVLDEVVPEEIDSEEGAGAEEDAGGDDNMGFPQTYEDSADDPDVATEEYVPTEEEIKEAKKKIKARNMKKGASE